MTTATATRERLEHVRAELDDLASGMRQVRRELKELRDAGESIPSKLEERVTELERIYRKARATLRRQEAASVR